MRAITLALFIVFALSFVPTATGEMPQRVFVPMIAQNWERVSTKKGVAPACPGNKLADETTYLRVSWMWDWVTHPQIIAGLESVPNIWGRTVPSSVGGNSQYLLGANEPELTGQANITPQEYVGIWREIEARFPDTLLISPQTVNSPAWLIEWRSEYISRYGEPPRLEGLAFHCYRGTSENCIILANQYIALADEWNISEVWVTEFAFYNSMIGNWAQALSHLESFVLWMENNPRINRYAYYTTRGECCVTTCSYNPMLDPYLFHWFGKPTPFGELYRRLG
jgi:hypothetical protein